MAGLQAKIINDSKYSIIFVYLSPKSGYKLQSFLKS